MIQAICHAWWRAHRWWNEVLSASLPSRWKTISAVALNFSTGEQSLVVVLSCQRATSSSFLSSPTRELHLHFSLYARRYFFILTICHQGECFCVATVEQVRKPFFEHLLFLAWRKPRISLALSKELPFIEENEDFPADARLGNGWELDPDSVHQHFLHHLSIACPSCLPFVPCTGWELAKESQQLGILKPVVDWVPATHYSEGVVIMT